MSVSAAIIRVEQPQYQQVLDAYGVGAISHFQEWHGVTLIDQDRICPLARVFIETTKGLFLLVHASDEALHPIWWEKDTAVFLDLLTRASGVTHAVPLATESDEVFVVHRFDERFTLFQL